MTKVGSRRNAKGQWPPARKPEQLVEDVHANLERLGLEQLDVVNLRVGGFDAPEAGSIAPQFEALAELRQQGLIRHLGLSTVTRRAAPRGAPHRAVVCVQNMYNVAQRGRTTTWST